MIQKMEGVAAKGIETFAGKSYKIVKVLVVNLWSRSGAASF